MPVEIRGNAILKIETINELVDEMLTLIRERMRLTPTQATMLEPICRRAVHQIARRVEFQPPVFGTELTKIVGASRPERAADEIERLFGPGWVYKARGPAGMGETRTVLMSRATLLALMDEHKAKIAREKATDKISRYAAAKRASQDRENPDKQE